MKSKTGESCSYQTAQVGRGERKARLEKMVATAQLMLALNKGVANVVCGFVPQTHSEKLATMLIIQT